MDVIRNNKPEIKARQLQHNKNNRDDRRLKLTEYMKDKSCSICGESHRACLQFHHIDDKQKEFTVADAVRGAISWKKILNEINKCDILCANCHAKETAIQQGWYKI